MIRIPESVLLSVQFAAAQGYPNEVGGVLSGTRNRLTIAAPYMRYSVQTSSRMEISHEWAELAHEIFIDRVGEWHTHPSAVPTLSRASDCSDWDRRKGYSSDEEGMSDGDLEWVVSVWPGKRGDWCFRHRIYQKDAKGRIRRVAICWTK